MNHFSLAISASEVSLTNSNSPSNKNSAKQISIGGDKDKYGGPIISAS